MSEEQSSQETHEVENNQPGQAGVPEGEIISGETGRDRTYNEKLDDAALRVMAKAFYDEQRAEYAKTHPEVESPGAREFLEQLGSHLNRFVDEINKGFRELSDKGREVMKSRPVNPETEKTEPTDTEPAAPEPAAPGPAEPTGEEYGEEYRQPGNK